MKEGKRKGEKKKEEEKERKRKRKERKKEKKKQKGLKVMKGKDDTLLEVKDGIVQVSNKSTRRVTGAFKMNKYVNVHPIETK